MGLLILCQRRIFHKLAENYSLILSSINAGLLMVLRGCQGHGKVMEFLNFLEFLEKSWNFD